MIGPGPAAVYGEYILWLITYVANMKPNCKHRETKQVDPIRRKKNNIVRFDKRLCENTTEISLAPDVSISFFAIKGGATFLQVVQ